MKKKVAVLKHSMFQKNTSPGNFALDYFSVFKFHLSEEKKTQADFPTESFRSDFFSIIHVTSGNLSVRIDLNDFDVATNGLFVVVPYSIKHIINFSHDCVLEGVSFTADVLSRMKLKENLLEQIEFFSSRDFFPWALSRRESSLFSQLVKRIRKRCEQLNNHSFGLELLANSITDFIYEMSEIGKSRIRDGMMTYGRKEQLVMNFTRLAKQHHLTARNLSFYSDKLFVSIKYLSETSKEITGKTASQFIDELDIIEAKRLLEDTPLNVSEISNHLNFSSPAFFSKFFKRLTSKSPKSYRKAFANGTFQFDRNN
ncbi:AraC family transcriptional regulator [Arcticibacter tournemirensis]|nr:helix-turn-helix domain-containing protein [Arcticibacter tournemirensis]